MKSRKPYVQQKPAPRRLSPEMMIANGEPSAELVRAVAAARHLMVVTGAGVSAESGIPTFRDPGGLWDRFRPEELANVDAFLRNPELVQAWYRHRREVAESHQPNPAHFAIAELEQIVPQCTLATQNVDGLHHRAGSRNVLELHGSITRSFCIDCGRIADPSDPPPDEGELARCTTCGGLIRPDVVWFGEVLPVDILEKAIHAATEADVVLSVGTSGIVYPAAGLPRTARTSGAYVAEFNIEPSALANEMNEVVLGPAGRTLPRLVEAVRLHLNSPSTG